MARGFRALVELDVLAVHLLGREPVDGVTGVGVLPRLLLLAIQEFDTVFEDTVSSVVVGLEEFAV